MEKLQVEAEKGEAADPLAVEAWFTKLVAMTLYVAQVAADTLQNPIAGLGTVFRLVAKKAQAQLDSSG